MPHLPQTVSRRTVLQQTVALAGAGLLPVAQASDAWKPAKPIRLVVPWTPGGASDILARLLANVVGNGLGQPIIVDNKAGASGSIGSQAVSTAAPDGTTLVVAVTDSHSIYPHVFNAPIFSAKDQVPVAPLAIIPFCLMVRQDLPVADLTEFVALAKSRQLTYSSWGNASAPHTASIMLGRMSGVTNMVHVPYTGTAPAIQAVMAGHVDFVIAPVAMALSYRDKLKALAVMMPQRVAQLPDVPTFSEAGLPLRKDGEFWIGIFAPPKTPAPIVAVLSQTFSEAMANPVFKNKVQDLGMISQIEPAASYARFYADDYERWGKLVRDEKLEQK